MAKFNHVLLVEDDPITIMVCDKILRMTDFGNTIVSKTNGHEALVYLQQILTLGEDMPEIIFLDINMPVLNGWDFLAEFETMKNTIHKMPRVFILSSTVDPEDYKRAAVFDCVENSISKPLMKEHLEKII